MADYLPLFRPGHTVTFNVTAAVTGGQPVEVGTADWAVQPAAADSTTVVGVAGHDAAVGDKVTVVKLNIDDHPEIPGQLGIQSIPAVIAFQKGQPVDGFVGVLPESQVKSFIERLVGPHGGADALLDEADARAAAGGTAPAAGEP